MFIAFALINLSESHDREELEMTRRYRALVPFKKIEERSSTFSFIDSDQFFFFSFTKHSLRFAFINLEKLRFKSVEVQPLLRWQLTADRNE